MVTKQNIATAKGHSVSRAALVKVSTSLYEWSRIVKATCSSVLEILDNNQGNVLAVYPYDSTNGAPDWLEVFLGCILRQDKQKMMKQLSFSVGGKRFQSCIVELDTSGEARIVGVFCFDNIPHEWQIHSVEAFASLYTLNHELQVVNRDRENYSLVSNAVEVTAEFNKAREYRAAAMSMVNSVASVWGAQRVSLGILREFGLKIGAISSLGTFENKMKFMRDIKDAMYETLDQNIEIVYPSDRVHMLVTRKAESLCKSQNMTSVAIFPLRYDRSVVGALMLERNSGEEFSEEECKAIRMMLELITPRMIELEKRSRWIGAKVSLWLRKLSALLLGAEYTWTKLLSILITTMIIFFIFAKGECLIDASFVLEPESKRIVAAPFDAFLKDVTGKPGDEVVAGESFLGELYTDELILQRAGIFAEQMKSAKEAALALSENKTVEAQIAEAKAREAAARLELLNLKLRQSEIIAPVSGYISSKEIDLRIGAPVQKGDILFEIFPGDSLEVDLYVEEGDIAEVYMKQQGSIAVMGYPDRKVGIEVFHISPVSQLNNDRNTFKVKARLEDRPEWMKPGMEGVAKLEGGEKLLIWMWTKSVVNWVRLKLWI